MAWACGACLPILSSGGGSVAQMGTEADQSQSWILLCRLALLFPFKEALTALPLPGWLTPEAVSNLIVACRTLGGL